MGIDCSEGGCNFEFGIIEGSGGNPVFEAGRNQLNEFYAGLGYFDAATASSLGLTRAEMIDPSRVEFVRIDNTDAELDAILYPLAYKIADSATRDREFGATARIVIQLLGVDRARASFARISDRFILENPQFSGQNKAFTDYLSVLAGDVPMTTFLDPGFSALTSPFTSFSGESAASSPTVLGIDSTLLGGLAGLAGQIFLAKQQADAQSDAIKAQLQIAMLQAQQPQGQQFAAPVLMNVMKTIAQNAAGGAGAVLTQEAINAAKSFFSGGDPLAPVPIAPTGVASMRSRLPQVMTIGGVDYVKRGRPLLYSSDFASAKRVRKVASKARARSGGRRRSTPGLTFCNGCTQPVSRCTCKG